MHPWTLTWPLPVPGFLTHRGVRPSPLVRLTTPFTVPRPVQALFPTPSLVGTLSLTLPDTRESVDHLLVSAPDLCVVENNSLFKGRLPPPPLSVPTVPSSSPESPSRGRTVKPRPDREMSPTCLPHTYDFKTVSDRPGPSSTTGPTTSFLLFRTVLWRTVSTRAFTPPSTSIWEDGYRHFLSNSSAPGTTPRWGRRRCRQQPHSRQNKISGKT